MKSVGIFICNYNKREFVVNCVKSLLEQSFRDFDLFVVDNASTDDSVQKLREAYEDKITIIENSENLGGSGGFNTGIRRGYNDGYKYIMLVDNDTVFDKEAVGELYKFLEANNGVGMVGAKIYQMQNPEYIQEMGGKIDWDNCGTKLIYRGLKDSNELEDVLEVDYLAACALMTRREVIENIGMMDETCFIYWDDIEWGYRCKLGGYRCCAISTAKVWHNATNVSKSNLGFTRYYIFRNMLNFFAKYIPKNEIEEFTERILAMIYKRFIAYYCKKQEEVLPVIMYAIEDFLNGVRGKAPNFKTSGTFHEVEPFEELILNSKNIFITPGESLKINQEKSLLKLINSCKDINPLINIYIKTEEWEFNKSEEVMEKVLLDTGDKYDNTFCLCNHVMEEMECYLPHICVDGYLNCIYNEEVYSLYRNITVSEKIFINSYKKLFINKIREINKGI